MSDDPNMPTLDAEPVLPDEYPGEEEVPEWLQRIRDRRAEEAARRQARDPGTLPAAQLTAPTLPAEDEPPVERADEPPLRRERPPRDAAAGPHEPPPLIDVNQGPPTWLDAEPDHLVGAPVWLQDALADKMAREMAAAPRPADRRPLPDGPPAAPVSVDETAQGAAAMSLRARRAQRRRERRQRPGSASVSAMQSLVIAGAAAALIATIFTFWTPASFLSDETREGLRPAYATQVAQAPPTPVPTPIWMRRVGIVSGHRGPHPSTGRDDPGAVCPDGLTEAQVNFNVAQLVVQSLRGRGYDVELLDEWDPRLNGFEASLLLSIHADSCHQFEMSGATGFKVAPPASRASAHADDQRLVDCLIGHYGEITGLPLHPSLTRDMTEYHSFGEISPITPAAIIELGFLYEDRDLLENHPDLLAQGVVSGLLCFLEAVPPTPLPELTPWPTVSTDVPLLGTPTPLEPLPAAPVEATVQP